MTYSKSILYTGLTVLILVLIVPLFLPGVLRVERSVLIHASEGEVFEMVADLERHPEWHPWDIKDSLPRIVFGEKRYGVDASYFWIGGRDNHGTLKWTAVDAAKHRIDGVLDLSSLGESEIIFRFATVGEGVEVREEFRKTSGHNLLMRYLKPLYRARVAEQLTSNLGRLKRVAEALNTVGEETPEDISANASGDSIGH